MLLHGFDDDSIVEGLAPTVAHLDANGLKKFRPDSWDAIVSVDTPNGRAGHLRVLQFGGAPLCFNDQRRRLRLERTVGFEVILTEAVPESLRDELKEVVRFVRAAPLPRDVIQAETDATEYFIPLITDADGRAFAAIYKPAGPIPVVEEVIYLPGGFAPSRRWVALAFERWSESSVDAFPAVADWTQRSEWMTTDERAALGVVDDAQRELIHTTARLESELADARKLLESRHADADRNERRLLTATGDDLVDAVAEALRQLGFEVDDRDAQGARHKLEDLRVVDGGWLALAEVKGYNKGGSTSDLLKLSRFVRTYFKEAQRFPDAKWYVVNQHRVRDPSGRPELLRGQDGDVEEFSADDGLVLDTRELFTLLQACADGRIDRSDARELLKCARGRFQAPAV